MPPANQMPLKPNWWGDELNGANLPTEQGGGEFAAPKGNIIAKARNYDPSISDHDMVLANDALDASARENMPRLDRPNPARPSDENFAVQDF